MNLNSIVHPTLLIHQERAIRNIRRMAEKARRNRLRFRPHFKTHQSLAVAEWFQQEGVHQITVSSVDMAHFFAVNGWRDITIAFPVNLRAYRELDELASRITLHLLVESRKTVEQLAKHLHHSAHLWIEIDVGYGRSGIPWNRVDEIVQVARAIKQLARLDFRGILTHAGHSYHARSRQQILEIHRETLQRMQSVREALVRENFRQVEISVGDTPTCSLAEQFPGVNEIRPGNFVFYDLMQWQLGSCSETDIAVALATPVVAVYPERQQVVVHGGAVHFSKESLSLPNQPPIFGLATFPTETGWGTLRRDFYVQSLSQEHGIVHVPEELLPEIHIGDLLIIVPVHSCLTVNLMRHQRGGLLII